MRNAADENFSGRSARLRVAAQAEIGIVLNEHFAIDRAVRIVANGAAFAHCLVFKHEWPRLVLMTLRATFVQLRHRESARAFENIAAVRVVALNAIHRAFDHGMMPRQREIGVNPDVTLKARRRIFSGIDDEFGVAGFGVAAAWSVTGFATDVGGAGGLPVHL